MEHPVGLRFLPTDDELVDHYLRLKNIGGPTTSHIDQVISTVNICNFDPWDLPQQSRIESSDQVWYFFGRKESRYNRGERLKRKTKSGFWKKTGDTLAIKRKRGDRQKMAEKRVLVFYKSGSLSKWVMHEYHATCFSPNQSVTYTICKLQFKGEAWEISSSATEIVEHSHSLPTPKGLSLGSEDLQNPGQLGNFLDKQQETQLGDATHKAFDNLLSYDWKSLLDHLDDDEKSKSTASTQKPLTGVFNSHR